MLRESRACDTLQLTLHILELLRWVSGPFGCLCPTLGARAAEAAKTISAQAMGGTSGRLKSSRR